MGKANIAVIMLVGREMLHVGRCLEGLSDLRWADHYCGHQLETLTM